MRAVDALQTRVFVGCRTSTNEGVLTPHLVPDVLSSNYSSLPVRQDTHLLTAVPMRSRATFDWTSTVRYRIVIANKRSSQTCTRTTSQSLRDQEDAPMPAILFF
jgi:hypothetical protein